MIAVVSSFSPLLGCGLMAVVMVIGMAVMSRGTKPDQTSNSSEVAALRKELDELRASGIAPTPTDDQHTHHDVTPS